MDWFAEVRMWLSGKKTYLLAALLVVTVLFLVFLGRLTPVAAMTVALVFAGLLSASFRSAIAEHQAQLIAVLMDVGQLGVAARNHDKAAELAAAQGLAKDAAAAAAQVKGS